MSFLDAVPALPAELDGLVEKNAFVGLISRCREIERGVGTRAGNANSCLGYGPLPPRSHQIKVVPVSDAEGL